VRICLWTPVEKIEQPIFLSNVKMAAKIFQMELRKLSVNSNALWDNVIAEWYVEKSHQEIEVDQECICTTPIKNLFYIRNKLNKKETIIGCECVKRWNIPCIVRCESCKVKFPRNVGITRLVENRLNCAECVRKQKKEKKEQQVVIDYLSSWNLFVSGEWYGKPFSSIIKNDDWTERLLNLYDSGEAKENQKNSLQGFKKYCSLLGYSLEEVM